MELITVERLWNSLGFRVSSFTLIVFTLGFIAGQYNCPTGFWTELFGIAGLMVILGSIFLFGITLFIWCWEELKNLKYTQDTVRKALMLYLAKEREEKELKK